MQGAESQTQNGGETAGSGRIWQDPAVSVRGTLGDSSSNIYIYIYIAIYAFAYIERNHLSICVDKEKHQQ